MYKFWFKKEFISRVRTQFWDSQGRYIEKSGITPAMTLTPSQHPNRQLNS